MKKKFFLKKQEKKSFCYGFTFIEILITVSVIAFLTIAVAMMINPGERLSSMRDDKRETHLNAIWLSIEQKIYRDGGRWIGCDEIPATEMRIANSEYDLYPCLYPDYLKTPLFDPTRGYFNSIEDYDTYYYIAIDHLGNMYLRAEGETREIFIGKESGLIVRTESATNIDEESATIRGSIVHMGGINEVDLWFEWGETEELEKGMVGLQEGITEKGVFEYLLTNLIVGNTYYFRAAAQGNDIILEGEIFQFTTVSKRTQSAPSAPTMSSRTSTSITLNTISNGEYRLGSGSWQSNNTFSGLDPGTSYSFTQRYAETETHYASSSSESASFSTIDGDPSYGTNTTVVDYNTDMYGYNFVTGNVVSIPNEWTTNIWTGNYWGARHIPVTVIDSNYFNCSNNCYCIKSGTNKFKIHDSRNVDRYMHMRIFGTGLTTSAQIGSIKLYFTDGWSGTINDAIATNRIHQVVYIMQTSSSSNYLWDLSQLASGGNTNSRSYPWVYIAFAPKVPLEYFEFWANKNFNTTYDGFRPYTSNIYPIWGE